MSGCGKGNSSGGTDDKEALKTMSYPLQTETTLKYWAMQSTPVGQYTSRDVYPISKAFEEKVGVKFEWISPAIGQETQQFNIMIASGELPDIIEWYWGDFSGGPDKAISDGYIANLNDLIKDYSPAFSNYLKNDPFIDKRTKTDQGNYYYYPGLAQYGGDNDRLVVTAGYMFRKDWLDELNLPVPETIDDWYTTLKAFRDQKGAEAPLCISAKDAGRGISGAFGIPLGWYQEDGKVKYGYVQPQFKEFVQTLNKWYNEGLLDRNTSSIDSKTMDSKLLNGQTGAVFGWIGSNMAKWLAAGQSDNPNFDLVGVPYPVMNKGDRVKFATKDAVVYYGGAAISATSPNKELAAKVLDYGYTEEGHLLMNFGKEGDSYTMVDGYPTYSDVIQKNPEGLQFDEALSVYTRAANKRTGPMVQDVRYIEQRYFRPQQQAAQKLWIQDNDIDKYALPTLTPTAEESSEFAQIMNNISTYVDEQYLKFVMGKESIDKFDEFVKQIEAYGLARATEIQQAALDRFNAR